MDEAHFEHAERLAEQERERGIKLARLANLPERDHRWPSGHLMYPNFNGDCVSCGDEIPAGRLAFGKVRCVPCQATLERKSKGL